MIPITFFGVLCASDVVYCVFDVFCASNVGQVGNKIPAAMGGPIKMWGAS